MTLHDYMVGRGFTPYDEKSKNLFESLGKAFLKKTKELLIGDTRIGYNKAGIACSGDFSLYVMFSDDKGACVFFNAETSFVTIRTIKHLEDYSGGVNRNYQFSILKDPKELATELRRVAKSGV